MTAVQKASAERRSPRLRALMGAKIIFNQGKASLDCLIRDISESGARLSASQAERRIRQLEAEVARLQSRVLQLTEG